MSLPVRHKVERYLARQSGPRTVAAIVRGAGVCRPTTLKWLAILHEEGRLRVDTSCRGRFRYELVRGRG